MKAWSVAQMDGPLQLAVRRAGGRTALFRALGLKGRPGWATTPQRMVFAVAEVSGVPPKDLRPDLAGWIDQEMERRRLCLESGLNLVDVADATRERWEPSLTVDAALVDLWSVFAALLFVSREKGVRIQRLCRADDAEAEAGRAYAMALAKVVGRASSTQVAQVFGCARQNVDNASERYMRARDGDNPEDFIRGQFPDKRPRVLELGSNRLRLAKEGDPALQAAEERFESFLRGEDLQPSPRLRSSIS